MTALAILSQFALIFSIAGQAIFYKHLAVAIPDFVLLIILGPPWFFIFTAIYFRGLAPYRFTAYKIAAIYWTIFTVLAELLVFFGLIRIVDLPETARFLMHSGWILPLTIIVGYCQKDSTQPT